MPRLVALADRRERRRERVDRAHQRRRRRAPSACVREALGLGATVTAKESGDLAERLRSTSSWRRWASRSRANWAGSRPERASRSTASSAARAVAGGDRVGGVEEQVGVGDAEQLEHVVGG